ncbi:MAG: hypothetical protein ACE5FZ_07865 [Nitrospiria bacterium]
MSVRRLAIIFLLLMISAGVFFSVNKPEPLSFPFAVPIQLQPGYRPPEEGVTLYPTQGPFGIGVIQTLTVGSDETLFVGTYGEGVFRSQDGGARWEPANRGLKDKFISNLTRLEGGRVFAGTIRSGLFSSRDNGEHWVPANEGLKNAEVQSMAILPGRIFAGTGRGVYISRDEGGHWEPYNEGLSDVMIRDLVATKDDTLFAATQGRGLFRRKAGETKWIQIRRGFHYQGAEERIVRTLVLGRNEALFVGTFGAGIFRSLDGGQQWQSANAGLKNLSIRSLSVDGSGILYAGTGEGVFYSKDDGALWTPLAEGLTNIHIHSFIALENGTLYAGTKEGLFRGRIGMSWEDFHQGLLVSPMKTLDYGPEGIAVGTKGKGTYVNLRDMWASDNIGLVNLVIRSMARGSVFLHIVTDDGIYRRQLGRHRWERLKPDPPVRALSIEVDSTDRIYVGTAAGLFQYAENGGAWERVSSIPEDPVIRLSEGESGLLAVTAGGIWVNRRQGDAEWKRIPTPPDAPFRFAVWGKGDRIFAATDHEIWTGHIEGGWEALEGRLPEGTRILSLALSPRNRNLLYAASDRGLYWSPDKGGNWFLARLYEGEFFEKQVNAVLPTKTSALWLATEEDGVIIGIDRVAKDGWLMRVLSLFQ